MTFTLVLYFFLVGQPNGIEEVKMTEYRYPGFKTELACKVSGKEISDALTGFIKETPDGTPEGEDPKEKFNVTRAVPICLPI